MHSRQSEVVARQENTLLSVQCKQTDVSTCNKKLLRCGEERLGFDLRDLPVLSWNNHIIEDMKFETMWDRRSSFLSFTLTKKKNKKKTDRQVEETKPDAPGEARRHAQNAQLVEEIIWQQWPGMKPRWWHMADSCCCFKYKTLDGKKSYGQPHCVAVVEARGRSASTEVVSASVAMWSRHLNHTVWERQQLILVLLWQRRGLLWRDHPQ